MRERVRERECRGEWDRGSESNRESVSVKECVCIGAYM